MPTNRPTSHDKAQIRKVLKSEKPFIIVWIDCDEEHDPSVSADKKTFAEIWPLFKHPDNKFCFSWKHRPSSIQLASKLALSSLRGMQIFEQELEVYSEKQKIPGY